MGGDTGVNKGESRRFDFPKAGFSIGGVKTLQSC